MIFESEGKNAPSKKLKIRKILFREKPNKNFLKRVYFSLIIFTHFRPMFHLFRNQVVGFY